MCSNSQPSAETTGSDPIRSELLENLPPLPPSPTLEFLKQAMSKLYIAPFSLERCPAINVPNQTTNTPTTAPAYTQVVFPLHKSNWEDLRNRNEPINLSPKDFRYLFLKQRMHVDAVWWWCKIDDSTLKDACKVCLRDGRWFVRKADINAVGGQVPDLII